MTGLERLRKWLDQNPDVKSIHTTPGGYLLYDWNTCRTVPVGPQSYSADELANALVDVLEGLTKPFDEEIKPEEFKELKGLTLD